MDETMVHTQEGPNKVFDSTYKENNKKTRKTISAFVGTKNLCVCMSKYSIERSKGQHKKSSISRKNSLTSPGNPVELL